MKNIKLTLMMSLIIVFTINGTLDPELGKSKDQKDHEFTLHEDIVFASPDGHDLSLDIYVPDTGKESYPVVVIWHGGGWLVNDNSVMDEMSAYIASNGEYIVCNMNYRLLVDEDNTVTMDEIVEDVFGGLLWVKSNIAKYGGNASKIAITGDSAGGHLTSMVLNYGRNLESDGFDGDSFGFNPTWLPEGKSAEDVAKEDGLAVQAAVVSYGAFDLLAAAKGGFETSQNFFWQWGGGEPRGLFGDDYNADDDSDRYKAVSPIFNIPEAKDYKLPPQFHHVGSIDQTTPEAAIRDYVNKMKAAGQEVSMDVFDGYNHAYLDSGCNEFLGSCFESHAVPALKKIIPFLDEHLQ